MGFEPTTPTLARLCSTPELRPLLLRLTAARRIWRKAKLNARLISASRAQKTGRNAQLTATRPRTPSDTPGCHCLMPRLSLSRTKVTETTRHGGGAQ